MSIMIFFAKPPPSPALDESNVREFLASLETIATPGRGAYAFPKPGVAVGDHGFVQILVGPGSEITIHRLWACHPGNGSGAIILRTLCTLADQHGVRLKLKVIPFGNKPYPLSREKLVNWYRRHGFEGTGKEMTRMPVAAACEAARGS